MSKPVQVCPACQFVKHKKALSSQVKLQTALHLVDGKLEKFNNYLYLMDRQYIY